MSAVPRNIPVYVIDAKAGSFPLPYSFVVDIIRYASTTMFPLNRQDMPFSEEKIPLITDISSLDKQGRYLGVVYGYARREGLSYILDERSRAKTPLSKRLEAHEDLYEHAHMVITEPGIVAYERARFAPTHGIMSVFLTEAAKEYCKSQSSRDYECDKIIIRLRQLYRPNIERLLEQYRNKPIRAITLKMKAESLRNLRRRTVLRAPLDLFQGTRQIELTVNVGRSRTARLELTIDEVFTMFTELREELGEGLLEFKISFGSAGIIDLVEDALVFRNIQISKAIDTATNKPLRMTDTKDAFSKLRSILIDHRDTIMQAANVYLRTSRSR